MFLLSRIYHSLHLRMTRGWIKDDLGISRSTLGTLAACFHLKGKHCQKPKCRNGVVDTLCPWLLFLLWQRGSPNYTISKKMVPHFVTLNHFTCEWGICINWVIATIPLTGILCDNFFFQVTKSLKCRNPLYVWILSGLSGSCYLDQMGPEISLNRFFKAGNTHLELTVLIYILCLLLTELIRI